MFTLYVHRVISGQHCQLSQQYATLDQCAAVVAMVFHLDAHVIGPEGEAYLLVETDDPNDDRYVVLSFERVPNT